MRRCVTFCDMYAPMSLTKNNTYDIENNTQEEADDDESRIDAEKDVAEDNNREIAVDDERDVEMFEEKGNEDSDNKVSKNAMESDEENGMK